MGVIYKKHVKKKCLLGIWEITEDYDTLIENIDLDETEIQTLKSFKSHNRKLEWLSVRNLVKEMIGKGYNIFYDKNKKPHLSGGVYKISITHSNKLTAILLSQNRHIGIDLEYMSHRIEKIASRFINEKEFISDKNALSNYHLYIHWCAKESLYKLCDKTGIHFKKNLMIEPFKPKDKGRIKGWLLKDNYSDYFTIYYWKKDDYIIAWCIK
jgi:4'-phosphopantetheinyl transferase